MECDNQSTTPNKDTMSCREANGIQSDEHLSQHTETSGEMGRENNLSAEMQEGQNAVSADPEGNDGLHVASQEEQKVSSTDAGENDGLDIVLPGEQNVNSRTPEGSEIVHNPSQESQSVTIGDREENDESHEDASQEEQSINSGTPEGSEILYNYAKERQNVNIGDQEENDGLHIIQQPKEGVNIGTPDEGDQLYTLFKEEETSPVHHRRRRKSISIPGYISENHSYPNEDTPEYERVVAEFILHLVHAVRSVNKEVDIVMVGPVVLTFPKGMNNPEGSKCFKDQMRKFAVQSVISSIAHSGTVKKREQFLENKPVLYHQGRITLEGRLYILMKIQSFIHKTVSDQKDNVNPYAYFTSLRAIFEAQRPGTPIATVEARDKKAAPHFVPRTKAKCEVLYITDYYLPNREEHMGFDRALSIKHIVMKKLMYSMLMQQVKQYDKTLKLIMFEVNDILERLLVSAQQGIF